MPAASPRPAPTPLRRWVERHTGPFLVVLHRAPRLVVALVPPALIVGGLVAPPLIGLLPILVGASFLGWLAYLSWPRVEPGPRLIRLVVLVTIVGYGLYRAVHG